MVSTIAITLLAARTLRSLRRFRYRPNSSEVTEIPTLSVCIAARNETHALAECLEQVLRSDYPKLEILVLDDSSDDDTSHIIKSFAHAGVRFIAGRTLPAGWLGKNHAYQTLIEESSGEYVLFIDVDTSLKVTTVSQLMKHLIINNKTMLSVLPRRDDKHYASAVLGTMRYYWELIQGTKNSPPAASALWLAKRSILLTESTTSLIDYAMSVRPERHLARQLQRSNMYYYIVGTRQLGVTFEKRISSQYETALRLYYPVSGRSVLLWLITTFYLLLLIFPIAVVLFSYDLFIKLWAICLVLLLLFTFGAYARATHGIVAWQLKTLVSPFLLLQEIVLLLMSYVRYSFGTVTWKGRAVNAQPIKHDAINLGE